MWLVWGGIVLAVLWYFEVDPVAQLNGWWLTVPFVLAFLWFELVEKRFGLDKKAAHDELDRAKKERIKRQSEQVDHLRRRR